MAKVVVRNLTKSFPEKSGREFRVVHGIDLEIQDREFMVLVGPSGCGKSTTLRMIAGLEEISGGTITIDERVINDVLPKDRDIAMVFQNYALYPHMKVFDNMAFGLKLRKIPRAEIEARVNEAAKLLGLEAMLDRLPKALSGGQRQRVAVGRAIVRKPKVFLFDEPLSNLDAKMRTSMRTEISKLHAKLNATMIYVTHDQVEAMTMGDRICVMKDGRIMQVAAPLELYERPKNLFVAGFIGSPAMNFFNGRIEARDRGVCFIETNPGPHPLVADLGERVTQRLEHAIGRDLILGVRAENVVVNPDPTGLPGASRAAVELPEPMGAETYLHLTSGTTKFIARTSPVTDFTPGQRVTYSLNPEKLHFFDPATEEAL